MILKISYIPSNAHFLFLCNDNTILEVVIELLGNFNYEFISSTTITEPDIRVYKTKKDQYNVQYDDIEEKLKYNQVLGLVIRTAIDKLCVERQDVFYLHGACLQINGKIWLLRRNKSWKINTNECAKWNLSIWYI